MDTNRVASDDDEYVVTFATRDSWTGGLRRMPLDQALALVHAAAAWNFRHGRILNADTGEEISR